MVNHLAISMHLKISNIFKQNICKFSVIVNTPVGYAMTKNKHKESLFFSYCDAP